MRKGRGKDAKQETDAKLKSERVQSRNKFVGKPTETSREKNRPKRPRKAQQASKQHPLYPKETKLDMAHP